MEKDIYHQQVSRVLAKKMAEEATEKELRRLYEETMYQQLISMETDELQEVLWHG